MRNGSKSDDSNVPYIFAASQHLTSDFRQVDTFEKSYSNCPRSTSTHPHVCSHAKYQISLISPQFSPYKSNRTPKYCPDTEL